MSFVTSNNWNSLGFHNPTGYRQSLRETRSRLVTNVKKALADLEMAILSLMV